MDQSQLESLAPEEPRRRRGRPVSGPNMPTTWPGRFRMVETYLESGLSIREFSKRHDIGQSTLTKWVSEYKKRGGASPNRPQAPEFVELTTKPTPTKAPAKAPFFVLELSNGRRLHLPFEVGEDFTNLRRFIDALESKHPC